MSNLFNPADPTVIEVSSVAAATAATTSTAIMSNMVLTTPPAGRYLVMFSCDINSATAGAAITVDIFVGGVAVSGTQRKVAPFDGGTLSVGAARCGLSIQQSMTVTGAQDIDIRWSASSNGPTVAARCITALRISP